ncbi:MAG: hypothetical protein E6R13_09020 [Spirochaetes bacterium]|nr:MAG: hypothetical protein E6R13_09020 [Spirochaetota bacterium]
MYDAIVIKLEEENFSPHTNSDNLVLYNYNGNQIILSKTMYKAGDMCLYFIPDTKISHWFLMEHKLYRKNPETLEKWKGFFENNGRVNKIKIRGEYSDGFIMLLPDSWMYNENDTISSHEGKLLCEKYVNDATKIAQANLNKKHGEITGKILGKLFNGFNEHIDTKQFVYAVNSIPVGSLLTITIKLHGTSGRTMHNMVEVNIPINNKAFWENISLFNLKNITFYEKNYSGKWYNIWKSFIPKLLVKSPSYQTGTRRVNKLDSLTNKLDLTGFHGIENFRVYWHNYLMNKLPLGVTVYYEIVGKDENGKYFMGSNEYEGKVYNYAYKNLKHPETNDYANTIVIYRVTHTDFSTGNVTEYSVEEIEKLADKLCVSSAPIVEQYVYDGNKSKLVEFLKTYCTENQFKDITNPNGILEGLVIRSDQPTGKVDWCKFKSDVFCEVEGIISQTQKLANGEDNTNLEDVS